MTLSMNQSASKISCTLLRGMLRWLPRKLEHQVMLLTSLCLVLSIMGYGFHRATEETAMPDAPLQRK